MANILIALPIYDSSIDWYVTDEGPEIKTFVGLSSPCTAIFAIFFLNVSVETNSIFLSNISKQKQKKTRLAALSILAVD